MFSFCFKQIYKTTKIKNKNVFCVIYNRITIIHAHNIQLWLLFTGAVRIIKSKFNYT